MNFKHLAGAFGAILALGMACCASAASDAKKPGLNVSCDSQKEPGKSYKGSRVDLPPLAQRTILGVWTDPNFKLTVALERVNGRVYEVTRSRYCSSGKDGELLDIGRNGTYWTRDSVHGDYMRIEANGTLGLYDNTGKFDSYAPRSKLFAD